MSRRRLLRRLRPPATLRAARCAARLALCVCVFEWDVPCGRTCRMDCYGCASHVVHNTSCPIPCHADTTADLIMQRGLRCAPPDGTSAGQSSLVAKVACPSIPTCCAVANMRYCNMFRRLPAPAAPVLSALLRECRCRSRMACSMHPDTCRTTRNLRRSAAFGSAWHGSGSSRPSRALHVAT